MGQRSKKIVKRVALQWGYVNAVDAASGPHHVL